MTPTPPVAARPEAARAGHADPPPRRDRRPTALLAAVVVLAVMVVASLAVGTQNVGLVTVWHAVTDYHDIGDQWIVHDLRIPRTVLGLLVGVALGLSGTVIQAVGRNPLADAEILGINSGAALFVVAAISLLGRTAVSAYVWFAFAGALVAMAIVFAVGMTGRVAATPARVLLAGVAVGAVLDGIGFAIRLHDPRAFDDMRFWDAGALDGRGLDVSATIAPFVVVGAVLCVVMARSLNVTALGDDVAAGMGANVARTRVLGLAAVTLLAGAATAGAGPIGFVGLMVPHAVRRLTGPDWRWILAFALPVAPTLLLAADVAGRLVIRPAELPAGIVTAFLGAPVLIWLVRRHPSERG